MDRLLVDLKIEYKASDLFEFKAIWEIIRKTKQEHRYVGGTSLEYHEDKCLARTSFRLVPDTELIQRRPDQSVMWVLLS